MLHKCGKYANYGTFVLRLVFGLIFLVHGFMKVTNVSATGQFFSAIGIPAASFFAIVVMLVEFLGGIALILGLFTRWASLFIAIDMLVAFFVVHLKNGFFVDNGGYEFVLILFATAVMFLLHGPGRYSLDHKFFKA